MKKNGNVFTLKGSSKSVDSCNYKKISFHYQTCFSFFNFLRRVVVVGFRNVQGGRSLALGAGRDRRSRQGFETHHKLHPGPIVGLYTSFLSSFFLDISV